MGYVAQGMVNSPTLCQLYVSRVLRSLREQHPQLYVLHYMDDILIAASNECDLHAGLQTLHEGLQLSGLVVAPEKMQTVFPFQYWGYQLLQTGVRPQKITLRIDQLHTLNDFHQLLVDINWIRPSMGLTTGKLKPLFKS